MLYHPLITIEVEKSYCIQKNATKSTSQINNKIRELSEDIDNKWSSKILNRIKELIDANHFNLPYDLLEVHKSKSKIMKYQFSEEALKNKNGIMISAHQQLESGSQDITEVVDTSLINNIKYPEYDDVQMAQLILLLSKLSKESDKLWINISIIIKELGSQVSFYFKTDNGHIEVSKRSKMNFSNNDYINTMNDIIDGKREIPITF